MSIKKNLLKATWSLVFILGICPIVQGQVNVLFLPESGFLQVEAQMGMEPGTSALSFSLFPAAQITEFWSDGLNEYSIERTEQSTVVVFTLDDLHPQTLNFSYEGFLEPVTTQLRIDRNTLWFPEFSFPVSIPEFSLRLPKEWRAAVDGPAEQVELGSFVLWKWSGISGKYPSFTLGAEAADPDEFWAKIQMQVTRLTNALGARSEDDIAHLLSPNLRQTGLAHYLATLPEIYGAVAVRYLSEPTFSNQSFQVVLSTERGGQFKATLRWQERTGRLELQDFAMTPYSFEAPAELKAALDRLVGQLQLAAETKNRPALEFLTRAAPNKEQIADFLTGLTTSDDNWSVAYMAESPLSISVPVTHWPQTRLLLNLGVGVDQQGNLLINSLEALPLN